MLVAEVTNVSQFLSAGCNSTSLLSVVPKSTASSSFLLSVFLFFLFSCIFVTSFCFPYTFLDHFLRLLKCGIVIKIFRLIFFHVILSGPSSFLFRCLRKISKTNFYLHPVCCLSVCLSVRLSAWKDSAPTGRIFMKLNF